MELGLHQSHFRFYLNNIAAAVNSYSPVVLAAYGCRLLASIGLPMSDTPALLDFIAYDSKVDHAAYADLLRSRLSVTFHADAMLTVYVAAWRQRYRWLFGRDDGRTREAMHGGLRSITGNASIDGPSLGRFGFDANNDVILPAEQVVLHDAQFVSFLSRADFGGVPTPSDQQALLGSCFVLPPAGSCQAPPPANRLGSNDSALKLHEQAVLGVLIAVVLLILVVLAALLTVWRRRRRQVVIRLATMLKDLGVGDMWVPPMLPSSWLKLDARIGEGFYGVIFVADLLHKLPSMTYYIASNSTIKRAAPSSSTIGTASPSSSSSPMPPPPPSPPRPYIAGTFGTTGAANAIATPIPLRVAVKQLKFLPNVGDQTHLVREMVAMARLTGKPFVLQALGLTSETPIALVMEYCCYGSLDALLRQAFLVDRPLTWALKLRMATQAARGLVAIHEAGIVHNDLAARNCLVTTNFVCKLADFGCAREIGRLPHGEDEPRLAVRWASPEALQGELTPANDVWALGVLLWEMAVNAAVVPYGDLTNARVVTTVLEGERLQPPQHTPRGFAAQLRRCWAPADKRPTARDLALQLFRARQELDMASVPPTPVAESRNGKARGSVVLKLRQSKPVTVPASLSRRRDNMVGRRLKSETPFAAAMMHDLEAGGLLYSDSAEEEVEDDKEEELVYNGAGENGADSVTTSAAATSAAATSIAGQSPRTWMWRQRKSSTRAGGKQQAAASVKTKKYASFVRESYDDSDDEETRRWWAEAESLPADAVSDGDANLASAVNALMVGGTPAFTAALLPVIGEVPVRRQKTTSLASTHLWHNTSRGDTDYHRVTLCTTALADGDMTSTTRSASNFGRYVRLHHLRSSTSTLLGDGDAATSDETCASSCCQTLEVMNGESESGVASVMLHVDERKSLTQV